MPTYNKNLKVGIYGLGLIGGSIYKNLSKSKLYQLYACTHNEETIKQLQNNETIVSKEESVLSECDIIFVCTPISKTIDAIKNINRANPNAIILDVASLKNDILYEVSKIQSCKFIGSHPMAGTENSGFDYAFAELFEGATWVLTPSKNVDSADIEMVKMMIRLIGANPIEMDAEKHDKAVALISHAPMLIAQSLMLSCCNDKEALILASSGFRDMTRLALSNKIMANDMLQLNKENIKNSLENISNNAQKLLNSDFFNNKIDKIISTRNKLYTETGKNNFRNND